MCYYSRTMKRHEYRNAKEGEDLTLRRDHTDHMVAQGTDGLAVCVVSGSELHIEELQIATSRRFRMPFDVERHLLRLAIIGKPVSGRFVEYTSQNGSTAADALMIGNVRVHISWLAEGTKCYTGPKRPTMEHRLGVDDPSIVHDHKPVDEMPTLDRVLGVVTVCSITR